MKYKVISLLAAMMLTLLLSACGDRMTMNDSLEPNVDRPAATVLPRATTAPQTTARPAETTSPTQDAQKDDGALEDAEKDIERTVDRAKDELSDGDGIVR